MPNERPTYRIELKPEQWASEADDPGAIRRLRAALKCLLRSFGLRAIHIEEVKPEPRKAP